MSTRKVSWYEIPVDPILIPTYCDLLQARYELEGCARMDGFYVEEIKLYKTTEVSQHEYLAAKVKAPDGSSFYISFERSRGKVVDAQPQVPPSESPSAPAQGPPVKISSLDSLVPKHKADDRVTHLGFSGRHSNNDRLYRTLFFDLPSAPLPASEPASSSSPLSAPLPVPEPSESSSTSCLPLYELAILANTLHNIRNDYLLFSDNCYFFAGTIIKVLQEVYNPEVVVETTGSRVLDKEQMLKTKGKKKKTKQQAGTWNRVEVYAGEKVDTTLLKEEFKECLSDFKKPVCAQLLDIGLVSGVNWFRLFRFKTMRPKRKPS